MADEFDLEQEVARLRGKLKALTVITVLFMLASGGLAAAVYMKVSKTPGTPEKLVVDGPMGTTMIHGGLVELSSKAGAGGAQLSTSRLEITAEGHHTTLAAGDLRLNAEKAAYSAHLSTRVAAPGTGASLYLSSEPEPARIRMTGAGPEVGFDRRWVDALEERLSRPPPPPQPAPTPPAPAPTPP